MTILDAWTVEVQPVCDGTPWGDLMVFKASSRKAALALVRRHQCGTWDEPYVWLTPPQIAFSPSGEIYAWREF